MSNAIRITRTLVSTDESMVGKKVRTLDGELRVITGCPSGTSYSVEGTRSRVYAYLIVKDGRNFKEITQEDLDGKVAAASDEGGYGKYTMLGKRAPKAPAAAAAPSTKPRNPKAPAAAPAAPAADKKPRTPKAPAAAAAPATKPATKKTSAKAQNQDAAFAQHLIDEGTVTPAAGKLLRNTLTDYIRDVLLGSPEFEGLFSVESESTAGEDGMILEVRLQLDMTPYFGAEEEEEEINVEAALDALSEAGFTVRQLRGLTDDEVVTLYNETFGENVQGEEEEEEPEFEEEEQEEEQEEEGDEVSLMEVHLPKSIYNNVNSLKGGKELTANTTEFAHGLGLDEVWPGVVLKHNPDDTEWAYLGMVHNTNGEVRVLLASHDAIVEGDERAARKSRKMVSIARAAEMYSVIFAEAEEEEQEEVEFEEEELEEEELEEEQDGDELQLDFEE